MAEFGFSAIKPPIQPVPFNAAITDTAAHTATFDATGYNSLALVVASTLNQAVSISLAYSTPGAYPAVPAAATQNVAAGGTAVVVLNQPLGIMEVTAQCTTAPTSGELLVEAFVV